MNTESTVAISLDYLIEFSDDGQKPIVPDSGIINIPPSAEGITSPSVSAAEPAPKV